MTHVAHGLRGDYKPARGDITGRQYLASFADKGDRTAAIRHTVNSMTTDGDPVTIVPERGGAPWAVPSHVVELIRDAIERGTL